MEFKTKHRILEQDYLHHTPCEVEETADKIIIRYFNNISAYVKKEKWTQVFQKFGFILNSAEA